MRPYRIKQVGQNFFIQVPFKILWATIWINKRVKYLDYSPLYNVFAYRKRKDVFVFKSLSSAESAAKTIFSCYDVTYLGLEIKSLVFDNFRPAFYVKYLSERYDAYGGEYFNFIYPASYEKCFELINEYIEKENKKKVKKTWYYNYSK